jgi:ATP-dependent 26S proteasome regulatory subunit
MMNEKNIFIYIYMYFKGVCTEAGMYALRERRVHVTQEDFELAVAKVKSLIFE